MTGLTRRGFFYGSAGAIAAGPHGTASAGAFDDEGHGQGIAPAYAARVEVDAHGAIGDCPRHGTTGPATDDSDAIETALRACPDGGVVAFTPGKCYKVSRPIKVTGKQISIEASGATIRCADDSVWHVFTLGGTDPTDMVEEIFIRGGTWDGNLAHQRYWPNTDGKTVFTDRGAETPNRVSGRPFYKNSPVNGTRWEHGWLNGDAKDRINLNGEGNNGLVRVQHARRVRFLHCHLRDYVRNGLVTWNCEDSLFLHCTSEGQLPSTYFELKALFGKGYEAAFIKVVGANPANAPLRGLHGHSARVIGGRVIGGAMPFFMRIQGRKPAASGSFCHIDGFEAYGIARELWFEDCAVVRISNSQIVCHPAAGSRMRNDPAVFFSNRTHDWVISNSYIRGRINTNQNQDRRFGVIESSIVDCEAPLRSWVVICGTISNSIIRSAGWGALCDTAVNSEFYAEGNAGLFATRAARDCRIGAPRRAGQAGTFVLAPGTSSVTLPEEAAGLNHIRIRNPDVMGGRWFDIHKSCYRLEGAELRLRSNEGPFIAQPGDEISVSWYGAGAPPAPYAGLRGGSSAGPATELDAIVENTRTSRISGDCTIRGQFLDIWEKSVFVIDDGASLALDGVIVRRSAGGIVASNKRATARRLVIRNCWFEDWGLWGDALPGNFRRPVCHVAVGDLLQLTQTTFLRTKDVGGHWAPGTNRGSVATLIAGDNSYAGGTKPARFKAERSLLKPDFTE